MIGHLGLGSNVGDRRAHLQAAVDALGAHGARVLASSSVYETEPVGEVPDQPVLGRFSTAAAAGGLIEEDGVVFAADGTLLAQSRQLALFSPLG